MKRVTILLADGFEEVEAITPIDFLRRADIEVRVAGVTGRLVTGGHGIRIETDVEVDDLSDDFVRSLDGVIIPGGARGAQNIADSASAMKVIRECLDTGRLVGAICAAPGVVLGGHGLVGDRRFTCYPGFESRVDGGEFTEERVVCDGNLITSRGPGTAAEFAFAVIENLAGLPVAKKLREVTLQPD